MISRCWTCQYDHDRDDACPTPAEPLPTPAPRPTRGDAITAKFPSRCADCHERINTGDPIALVIGTGWVCAHHLEES